jgi:bifunctional enzyme CysN/CysC
VNLETLQKERAEGLALNDIACVSIRCHKPIFFDSYAKSRATGAFILVDSITNNTVAAGMIGEAGGATDDASDESASVKRSQVSRRERRERLGQSGATIWLTGLPAAGKTEIAYALERRLFDLRRVALVVDPTDDLSDDGELDYMTPAYAIQMARRNADAGLFTIFAYASPTREERATLRTGHREDQFVEVYVDMPRERRIQRDTTAAYSDSKELEYQVPERPDVTVSLEDLEPEAAAEKIIEILRIRHLFDEP